MKIGFETILQKFGSMGEKTGWTYIEVPGKVAKKLKPGYKKSFRVKGTIDKYQIEQVATIPMGDGKFIIAVNAGMRRAIRKKEGDKVSFLIELDEAEKPLFGPLLDCLKDEPAAWEHFTSLPRSHQQYYSNWIESAKTETTKIKRIAMAVNGLARKMDYGAMLREERERKLIR
jgi:hypothetical protein